MLPLPQLRALAPIVLLLLLQAELSTCKGSCKRITEDCPSGYTKILTEEADPEEDGFTGLINFCCKHAIPDNDMACKQTECFPKSYRGASEEKICSSLPSKSADGRRMDYELAVRDVDNCKDPSGKLGVRGLCCPKSSQDGLVTLLLGAEKHQFPHQVMLYVTEDELVNGKPKASLCGGTIYNERYIVTASHCFVEDGKLFTSPEKTKVFFDVRLADTESPLYSEVEKIIIHPNSSLWRKGPVMVYDDVALLKLKNDIKFGPHVKALPLAKPGFNPIKYSNETLIMGVGRTDTYMTAGMLQRGRALLRNVNADEQNHALWGDLYEKQPADSSIYLGGIVNETSSVSAGEGDSGGPAVCRDENGFAVLCGISSTGTKNIDYCKESLTEQFCTTSAYMAVQHYYNWIVKHAGDQKKAEVLKQPLFGAAVKREKYLHQVHITSSEGPSCGGTLIEKDLVVTAAHCVADDKGNTKNGLIVMPGVRNASGGQGEKYGVKSIKVLEGFRLGYGGKRQKRVIMIDVKPTPKYPYYKNDLALVKLVKKVDIESKSLPIIGPAPEDDGESDDVKWTTEVSLSTDTILSGALQQREFQILDKKTCQRRINRASYVQAAVKIDENVMCGEEKYNGGAQCDRELGGGLICKGDNGNDVLCGVQVFRFCQLALPSAFLDINRHTKWIEENKSRM